MSEGETESPLRACDPRAALVLGACTALALGASADAVLLPHIDRAPPRTLALFAAVGVLGLGALLGARLADRADRPGRVGARTFLGWALLVLGGGLLTGAWTGLLHARLLDALVHGSPVPYHALVLLAGGLSAAPVALPLGALTLLVLRGSGRARLPFLLAGASAGCAVLPYLAEVLLGHVATVRLASLVGAAASLVALEHAPLAQRPLRLPAGRLPLLVALGGVAALVHRQTLPYVELGTLGAAWHLACLLLGAALGCARAHPRPERAAAVALAACALPLLSDATAQVTGLTAPGLGSDVFVLLATSLPIGVAFGLVLGRDDHVGNRGAPLHVGLAAAWMLVPVVSWVLLPLLGPLGSALLLATLVMVGALLAGATRRALVAGLSAGACLLVVPWPWPERPHEPSSAVTFYGPDGNAALVIDPTDGDRHVALDGRALLGLSHLQRTRLVDLPLLLAHEPERVLVVSGDLGEAAARALLHQPTRVDWLSPTPSPLARAVAPTPFLVASVGSERLFLAAERPPWDSIVLLPDARARRRAHLLATVEFYAAAERRLSPDGLFCQWWDAADTDVPDLAAALSSAQRAFPFVYLAMDHPRSRRVQLGVIGTRVPLEVRPDRVAEALTRLPRVRRDLADVGLDAFGVSCLVLQHPRMLAILAPPENALHDSRSHLGVLGGLRGMIQPDTLLAQLEAWVRWRCDPMAWIVAPTPAARSATAVEVRDRLAGWQRVIDGTRAVLETHGLDVRPFENEAPGAGPPEEAWGLAAALRPLPDWAWAEDEVRAYAARLVHDDLLADAEGYLREAVRLAPGLAELRAAYADVLLRAGERDEARTQLVRALQLDPGHPEARAALASLGD